jgi:hypothetical protein
VAPFPLRLRKAPSSGGMKCSGSRSADAGLSKTGSAGVSLVEAPSKARSDRRAHGGTRRPVDEQPPGTPNTTASCAL